MQKSTIGVRAGIVVAVLCGLLWGASYAQAQTSSSQNFQMSEPQFGAGQELNACSGNYCAKATIGNLEPDSESLPTSTEFGAIPEDSEPLLEVIVDAGTSDLGTLESTRTATKTMIVRIRTYMSDGYMLQIHGTPPTYESHQLRTSSSPVASTTGVEQFGINAVANTSPEVGANPVQVPSEDISFGQVMPEYAVPDLFKYINGDTIASSDVETGRTDYTISMIINISNATPAGHYSGDYSAVVIPRF